MSSDWPVNRAMHVSRLASVGERIDDDALNEISAPDRFRIAPIHDERELFADQPDEQIDLFFPTHIGSEVTELLNFMESANLLRCP